MGLNSVIYSLNYKRGRGGGTFEASSDTDNRSCFAPLIYKQTGPH